MPGLRSPPCSVAFNVTRAMKPATRSQLASRVHPRALTAISTTPIRLMVSAVANDLPRMAGSVAIGSVETILLESVLMTLFVIAAVAGFKGSPWIVVGGLAAHGVQDAVHGYIVANAGVPAWWPAWCLAYDVGAAIAFAWLLMRADLPSTAASSSSPTR